MLQGFLQRWSMWCVPLWLVLCALGLSALWTYSNTPGEVSAASSRWSPKIPVALDQTRPTLVMFAHPRCPCTRASLSEIERLQALRQGAFVTKIIFYEPVDADPSWRQTYLWNRALQLPETTAHPDPGGVISTAAQAHTSGMVAIYSPGGALKFSGGVTPARGHEGDNPGIHAILAVLRDEAVHHQASRVFGCPLLSDAERAQTTANPCDETGCVTDAAK